MLLRKSGCILHQLSINIYPSLLLLLSLSVELGKSRHASKDASEWRAANVEKKMLFLRNKRLAQPRIIRLRAPSYYTEKERAFVYDQNRKDIRDSITYSRCWYLLEKHPLEDERIITSCN